MQAIESNKKNHPILNQIYDILADLKGQKKHITFCKVPAHTGIKGNEEADKAAKEATDMPGMTTTRLPFTDYLFSVHQQKHTILNHISKTGKVHAIAVGNMRSN